MEITDNNTFPANAYYLEYKFIPQLLDLIKSRQISPKILVDTSIWEKLITELGGTIIGYNMSDIKLSVTKLSESHVMIIYIFPEPKVAPEAKYGAIVADLKSSKSNYLTLELSVDGDWFLGSTDSGCHFNYGKTYHELGIEEFGQMAVSFFPTQ